MLTTSYQLPATSQKGFTLIEALVLLFIFAVISVTFLQTYTVGTRLIIDSKNRLGATALANQKMEIIRSIDYDTLGTKHLVNGSWVYGVPAGDILEDETVNVNTTSYLVHTFVQYVDDPFDGQAGHTPGDAIPNDYKRIRLTVSWGDGSSGRSIALFSNVSPNGIETSAGGGVLTINILDSSGAGIPGIDVHIVNTSTNIDVTAQTDSTGNITLPSTPTSVPAGTQDYVLTVSKNGYYGAVTYPPYPTSTFDPVDEHVSVVAGALNPITIVIDHASDIALHTVDPFGTSIPNINFTLDGGRILGITPPATQKLGFSQTTSTDVSGNKTFVSQSYGQYTLSTTNAQYQFYKLDPGEAVLNVLAVSPGVNKDSKIILLDTSIGSAKIQVENNADNSIIAGATVQLTNAPLVYDVTQTTDQYGLVYFPATLPALAPGTYDVTVTATGFTTYTGTITIGNTLQTETIKLTAG